ncbi:PEP-utilizing enzyme, partial [Lysinibacillus varians]
SLGFVLNYNKLGLQDFKFNSNKLLENMFKNKEVNSYSKFVLDFNQFSRQIIIEKEELVDNLLQHLPKDSDFITNTVIIRPFFSGEAGLIVSSGELGMFIDISEKGLLSLNRGIIESSKITFNEKHEIINISSNCPHYIIDAVKKNQLNLANCVNEINSEFNTTTTEWIYEKGIFCFIDYSNKGKVNYENIINTSIISRGAAKGKIFDLTKYSEELHRLSIGAAVSIDDEKTLDLSYHQVIQEIIEELEKYKEKPIVLAKLPYACLSGILNIASGFIFEKGSTLCHLAILLRENDIPAVVANRKIKSEEVTIIEGNIYEK